MAYKLIQSRPRSELVGLIMGFLVQRGIPVFPSHSDHMYRMAVLAMMCTDQMLDVSKCVMMALVHDLAEAQSPAAQRMEALWKVFHLHSHVTRVVADSELKEYEAGETPEARFVKDLDRFEMASQALEYEKANPTKIFRLSSIQAFPNIRHEEVRGWGESLLKERNAS
ncbi:hypothetical protein BDZ89DRAFT_1040617 [Hymenopellis radicata]|nr:hypothetical protein BDZ89DRAFT_1040617 [Hymenopellis radicata]